MRHSYYSLDIQINSVQNSNGDKRPFSKLSIADQEFSKSAKKRRAHQLPSAPLVEWRKLKMEAEVDARVENERT